MSASITGKRLFPKDNLQSVLTNTIIYFINSEIKLICTKRLDDFGVAHHETMVPILRVPAIALLYILRKTEAEEKTENGTSRDASAVGFYEIFTNIPLT